MWISVPQMISTLVHQQSRLGYEQMKCKTNTAVPFGGSSRAGRRASLWVNQKMGAHTGVCLCCRSGANALTSDVLLSTESWRWPIGVWRACRMVDTAPVLASAQLTQCGCLSAQTGVCAVGDGLSLATYVHIDSAFRGDTWHGHGCSLDLRPSWQYERVPEVSCLGCRCAVEMHLPRTASFSCSLKAGQQTDKSIF